ncbi:MAG: hypothetical protein JST89_12100 [Cyanobacteria bacterium SZAS-4]|nr:hypothetical protein [Cyanobacteria bacterium SZAS-4]
MVSGFQSDGWYDVYRRKKSSAPSGQSGKKKGGGGGGGGKKSRLGRVGVPGRLIPKDGSYATKRSVIIKAKYSKTTADSDYHIQAWLTYCSKEKSRENADSPILTRERIDEILQGERPSNQFELRDPEFFSATRQLISRQEAIKTISDNKGSQIADYEIILSPGDRTIDPYEYTRDQMSALEKRLGHSLIWVANVHRDTGPDQAHINVTIAGKIPGFKEIAKADRVEETREKDPAYYALDLSKVSPKDQIKGRDEKTYTKFDSLEKLKAFDDYCKESFANWLPKPQYQKLWSWIGAKTKHGEDVYGKGPQKKIEREIDLERLEDKDKILISNRAVTPFHTKEQLEAFQTWQDSVQDQSRKISAEDQSKLQDWIRQKNELGENYLGDPPMREKPAPAFDTKRSIDLTDIPESERINLTGRDYTKFDTSEDLIKLQNFGLDNKLLSNEKEQLLQSWLDAKRQEGEQVFGKPKYKDVAIDKTYVLDEKKIAKDDKIQIGKETWSKYSSTDQLIELIDKIQYGLEPKDARSKHFEKLDRWLSDKERNGHGFEKAPPVREIVHRYRELDLSAITEDQRVSVGGNIITKFHPLEVLREARHDLDKDIKNKERNSTSGVDKKLDKDKESEQSQLRDFELLERAKLQLWIELKERFGEPVVGTPPTKNLEIDYGKIGKGDRIHSDGKTHTKYDSKEDLLEVSSELGQKEDSKSQAQKSLVDSWIKTKEELGRDDVFGDPPLKSIDEQDKALDSRYIKDPLERAVAELLGEGDLSVEAVNLNRALNKYDRIRQWEDKDQQHRRLANERGDVFLDKATLNYLRARGNEYVHSGRAPARELDREIERELDHSRLERQDRKKELLQQVIQLRKDQRNDTDRGEQYSIDFTKEGDPYLKRETFERLRLGSPDLTRIPDSERLLGQIQLKEIVQENATDKRENEKREREREGNDQQDTVQNFQNRTIKETFERLRYGPSELTQMPDSERLTRLQDVKLADSSEKSNEPTADKEKEKEEREQQEQVTSSRNTIPDPTADKYQTRQNMVDSGIMQLGQMNDANSESDRSHDDQTREHEDGLQR